MAEQKLVGQNYSTPDLRAKVTGRARYAEDFRAPGMLFARLLLSPFPHARVKSIDTSAALAMPGVKAILTADVVPGPKDQAFRQAVRIAFTPGMASAALVSMLLTRACGKGLRRSRANSIPGARKSSVYRARPVTLARSSGVE